MTESPMLDRLRTRTFKILWPTLDVLAILAWAALLLKYWISGQLRLLIHPNYFGLVLATSLALFTLGGIRGWQLLSRWRRPTREPVPQETVQHLTLFPPGWASGLLLGAALAGFSIPPTVLASQVALQRGVSESLPVTQVQAQTFKTPAKPEERSLIEWIRTLNAYPEPDAYTGQKVKVTGFVVHLPQLPDNYLFVSRFVLTCCAVDAYPVGLPVKLPQSRSAYPPDTWLEIEGEMMTETLPANSQAGGGTSQPTRQLAINAETVRKIDTPADPYNYN